MSEIIKNRVFNHNDVNVLLCTLGFKRNGNNNYSLYINKKNGIVAYYVRKKASPKNMGAFVFIHKDFKEYAYNIDELENTYLNLINKI